AEFDALDAGGAVPISLGATILRAEVAAVVAISRVIK
ncbi:RNA methyltransferase, partial [bacterium]|nr:RNA methyltransferase [bacterium]